MDMYVTLLQKQYTDNYSHIQVIPLMAIQMVKPNKNRDPNCAKTQVVALGNHEDIIWDKSNKFGPILRDKSSQVMTSLAVQSGRREKQEGDCKNAFCQSYWPKDETIIITPPKECPVSKIGSLWLL
jgi:hypothetical protein